ncbi:MAG: sugar phosphate isomerase/epimerase family protein [Eubacteriales bacterium]
MTNKNRKFYISTGVLVGRGNGYDYRRALREIGVRREMGLCDGIELMMLPFYYDKIETVAEAVGASGLVDTTSVLHCEKEIGTMLSDAGVLQNDGKMDEAEALWKTAYSLYRENCRMGERTGLHRMVLHLWGGISSDGNLAYNASKLPVLAKTAAESGIRLLIENIPSNHADPLSNWLSLLPLPENTAFIFDTRFGKLHEQTTETLTHPHIIPSIEHVHVSDFGGGYRDFRALRPILHPGEGKIDFAEDARLLDQFGYTGTITLESPIMNGAEYDFWKLEKTLTYLNAIL